MTNRIEFMQIPEFNDKNLKTLAFTHRSYLNENRDVKQSNERLEFLGDSILSFVVSTYIYAHNPDVNEGELTSLRSVLTNTQTLFEVSQRLDLGKELLMSKGEEDGGGRTSKTILANTYEAVVGGLFLDGGIEKAKEFIENTILSNIEEFVGNQGLKDPKSMIQEYMQEKFKVSPEYRILDQQGPDHNREYTAGVFHLEKLLAQGVGRSKQEAEKNAAQEALKSFGIN